MIGSSYSWDAIPSALDDDPAWHIYCAKSLDYIFEHPYGHCKQTSTPWPEVLEPPAETYAYISFQPVPFEGSTLERDIETIEYWLLEQPPQTVAVIHTSWPEPMDWEASLHATDADHTFTNTSLDYFYSLEEELELANPGFRFVLTRSNEMLDFIYHDDQAPIDFLDMFRDDRGHMSFDYGRYLQHNAFRQAMGQPTGVDATVEGVSEDVRAYLDGVVAVYPPQ